MQDEGIRKGSKKSLVDQHSELEEHSLKSEPAQESRHG